MIIYSNKLQLLRTNVLLYSFSFFCFLFISLNLTGIEIAEDCPQQGNSIDCGIFILEIAKRVVRNEEMNFEQKHMQYLRLKKLSDLFKNKIQF